MPSFTKWGDTYMRQDDSGQLFPVTDPDTLKGLKTGQLGYSSIENTRGLTFGNSGSPTAGSTSNPAGGAPQGDVSGGGTDIKSIIGKLLQKQLTSFQGVSNSAELETRRQALLKDRMLASPGRYAPGGDVSKLGASGATSALGNVGSEFEPAIKALELQINTAKQGDEASMNNLIKLISLGKDAGVFGGTSELKTSITEANGRRLLVNSQTGETIKDLGSTKNETGDSGLSASVLSKVSTIAQQHDTNDIIKNYSTIQNKSGSMERILQSGVGGPGDLALVFEFMKALDPTSVVRESEYATASKSGNLFLGVFAKFNGYLKEEGGFLPPNVQKAFVSIMKTKLGVAQKQYDNYHNEQARKINHITGATDGDQYLTGYGKVDFGNSVDTNKRVTVISPDGKTKGTIPASQLESAISQGYKQIQ